jgi:hypothetical protein
MGVLWDVQRGGNRLIQRVGNRLIQRGGNRSCVGVLVVCANGLFMVVNRLFMGVNRLFPTFVPSLFIILVMTGMLWL